MKKRWGVRVIAFLMLIIGLLLFLAGVAPAVLMAIRGAGGGFERFLAVPSVLVGCAGALPLLVAGSVLLTLGRVSDNFAAVTKPAPVESAPAAAPAPAAVEPEAAVLAAAEEPGVEAPPQEAVEAPTEALVVAAAAEGWAASETEASPAVEVVEEVAPPAEEAWSPPEEVSALQVQLAALQAQLNQLGGAPLEAEELPTFVDDEGPAPGAAEAVTLPGADEAARVGAEVSALKTEP